MKPIKLVGINGFKRSGKGEVADALFHDYVGDGTVHLVGFADKLKQIAALSLGFDRPPRELIGLMDQAKTDWLIHVAKTTTGQPLPADYMGETLMMTNFHVLSGREFLQNLGNEARGVFGDDFWVDQVLPRPVDHCPGMNSLDHHIQNSLNLRRYYGEEVDVVAFTDLRYPNEAKRVQSLGGVVWEVLRPGTGSDGHASEQPLPPELVDYQIHNDGDLVELAYKVSDAIEATL